MTGTPLLDRINARKGTLPEPQPIAERMSPFMRRLRDKQLPVTEIGFYNGAATPSGERGAA